MTHRATNPGWTADEAVVVGAWVYPVKSCGAMPVDELVFDRWGGAEGDRRWAVVDASAPVTGGGAPPRLALVQPRSGGEGLALRAPGREPLGVRDDGLAACEVGMY